MTKKCKLSKKKYSELESLFERQQEFQNRLRSGVRKGLTPSKRNALYKESCLFAIEEIIEGLRCVNHKTWKKKQIVDDIESLKDELIDEFRFFINRCLLVDMTVKEIFARMDKSFDKTDIRLKNNY